MIKPMKKLVVVTGATKGIGRAISELFLSKGFSVAVCARNVFDLEEMKLALGENCHIFKADVSVKVDVEAFGQFTLDLNLPIAALVNNAGVFMPGKILDEPEGNLETQINTNIYSVYYLTRKLIARLRIEESSHIFNICSIASLLAYPASGSYSISKFALLGFSKSIREELKTTSIKVTSVMPGATLTDSWEGVDLPESRFIKAEDVAQAVWSAFSLSKSAVIEEIIIRPQLGDL